MGASRSSEFEDSKLREDLLLYPAIALSALICVLAATASLRIALHWLLPLLYPLLLAVPFTFLWRARKAKMEPAIFLVILISAVAAWLALVDFSGRLWPAPSETITWDADAWSYNALADYLTNNSRGRDSGMSILDQFGAHLANSRFASASLLAFIEGIRWLGDPPTAHSTLIFACFVTHFFSILYLARTLIRNWFWSVVTSFSATAAGWLGDATFYANYDNLLFASLAPGLVGILVRIIAARVVDLGGLWWRGGLLAAAMLYSYPEGWPLLLLLLLPLLILLTREIWRAENKSRFIVLGGMLATTFSLALPYLPTLIVFLVQQVSGGLQDVGVRPGAGYFPQLTGHRFLAALFALGEEIYPSYSLLNDILPVILLFLIAVGVFKIRREFAWYPWIGLILVALIIWQDAVKHYDYGTYKVILCASWWVYSAMVAGIATIAARISDSKLVGLGLVAILLFAMGTGKLDGRRKRPPMPLATLQPLRELPTIRSIIGNSPILLDLDLSFGSFDYLWSVYYLRYLPINVATRRSYLGMPHIARSLDRAAAPHTPDCKYVLISGSEQHDTVWHNARFSLLQKGQPYVSRIDNPNGTEVVDNQRFIWLSTQESTLHVVVSNDGTYELRVSQFWAGPYGPDTPRRALRVVDTEGLHLLTVNSKMMTGIPLHLHTGDNAVKLQCLDVPRKDILPIHGDSRELMLGLKGFYIFKTPDTALSGH